jgi:hypothetical protein
MKKYLILLTFMLPLAAFAQLEVYDRYTPGGKHEPNVNYFGSKKLSDRFSLTYFGLLEHQWGEALVGASYAPLASLILGLSAGIEHGTTSPRYSASIWTGNKTTTFSALWELGEGKSNYLYKANLFYKYTNDFTVGVTAWRKHGVGPNFRYMVPHINSTLWIMPAYDLDADKTRVMAGITIPMQ